MIKTQTKNGVQVGDRGNEALGVDVVRILKTQDEGWVRVQIAKDEKVCEYRCERVRPAMCVVRCAGLVISSEGDEQPGGEVGDRWTTQGSTERLSASLSGIGLSIKSDPLQCYARSYHFHARSIHANRTESPASSSRI